MTLLAALLVAFVESERHLERELPAQTARALVTHSFGECRVLVAGPKEKPRARLDLVASGVGADVERRYLDLVVLEVSSEPTPGDARKVVTTVRSLFPPEQQQPERLSFAATLTVWLPESAAVDLKNGYGKVTVDGRRGDVKVVNQLAPVDVRNVIGDVEVDDQFDQVTLTDVIGDATVRGKSAAVTAQRVSGHVDLRTNGKLVRIDHAGSAHVENRLSPVEVSDVTGDVSIVAPFCAVTAREVGGSLTLDSSNGPVTIAGVGKGLSIQHKTGTIDVRRVSGDATVLGYLSDVSLQDVGGKAEVRSPSAPVSLSNVGGRLVAENSSRPLELVNPRGDVEASARGGLLKVRWTRPPAGGEPRSIVLEGEVGGIELELPDGAAVALVATSTTGQIDCSIPGMSFAQAGSARTGTLRLGDPAKKDRLEIHATCVGGAIRVRRAGAR